MTDLTIAIATCGRERVLRRCLASIKSKETYPHKTIILDNTKAFVDDWDTNWIEKKCDELIQIDDRKIGCSESNNILKDHCDTDYIMHLDDDIYFQNKNTLDSMMKRIKQGESDILSCLWNDTYYNRFREANIKHITGFLEDGRKAFWKISIPKDVYLNMKYKYVISDEALHSMIVPMEVYNRVSWDNNFSWKGDREDFFLSCKKEGITVEISLKDFVVHSPQKFEYGSLSYEFDGVAAKKYFEEKWRMVPMFGWDGPQDKPK